MAKENIIDRVIGYFSPQAGVDRTKARITNDLLHRNFDAAKNSRYSSDWLAASNSAATESMGYLATMRYRSRDLIRNAPMAARAINVWTNYLVGTGIRPEAKTKSGPRNKRLMAAWKAWAESTFCDANGKLDFSGIQGLAIRTERAVGEVLVRKVPVNSKRAKKDAPPFKLQLLDPDYIDETKTEKRGSNKIVQGIEYDQFDQIVAYWLFQTHPNDPVNPGTTSVRVDAADIIHVFVPLRPGQVRGLPVLHPVVTRMREKQEHNEAVLVRAKGEACFTAWVEINDDSGARTVGPASMDAGERFESLEPGMINYLRPGEKVSFPSLTSSAGYGEFNKALTMEIAVGTGLPYHELSGDLAGAGNYSSIRAGTISFRRAVETIQWQVIIPQLCQRVWDWFVDECERYGIVPEGDRDVEWNPPRFELIDPEKDYKAEILAIRNGLTTLPAAIARMGDDPEETLQTIADTAKKLDELGLVLDCDPRRTTMSGQAQSESPDTTDSMSEDPANG